MSDGVIAADKLKSFIERLETLEDEKQAVADQIRDVFAEAKGEGFDTKIIRQLLRLRKMQDHDRIEQQELLEIYKQAVGMM